MGSLNSWRHKRAWLASLALFVLVSSSQLAPTLQRAPDHRRPGGELRAREPLMDPVELALKREGLRGEPRYKHVTNYNVAADWAAFNRSGVFIDPFEPALPSLPPRQLEFQRDYTAKSVLLYHDILMDLIESRNKFAASARMMLKWGSKLIQNLVKMRRGEMAIEEKYLTKPAFFNMLADLVMDVEATSTLYKESQGYDKENVPIEPFRERVDFLFDYYKRVVEVSPVGNYLRWNTALLYRDQPAHPLHQLELKYEAADLLAQARALGYEGLSFMARRVSNLLRLFGRGEVPEDEGKV